MQFSFIIPEPPKGKARPRHNRRTGATYTTPEDHLYESIVRQNGRKALENYLQDNNLEINAIDEPVSVTITAYYQIPKSYSKKKTLDCLEGRILPTKKPDIDNVDKAILDGLNPDKRRNPYTRKLEVFSDGVYTDDALVINNDLLKLYSTEPRVEVVITWGEELTQAIKSKLGTSKELIKGAKQ